MGSSTKPSPAAGSEGLAAGILEVEEEITRRLAYEDLLWVLFRQIWTNHWELNIDLVCWLDDARTPAELECVLDMARAFWSTISHLRKLVVDDMMNNGLAVNHLVNSRRARYKEIQSILLPSEIEDLSSDVRGLFTRFKAQPDIFSDSSLGEYFSNILDIGQQIDHMIASSAASDRGDLWSKSQKMFEHNDKVTEALIIAPSKLLDLENPRPDIDMKLLDLLSKVSRAKRAFAIPPYSLTEIEIDRGMDPARSAEAIPIDRTNDSSYICSNLTGPMWLCSCAWADHGGSGLISSVVAQALAVCARSSSELVDANSIAASLSIYKFLCKNERPKLQRCSGAPYRPALSVKLDEKIWKQWAQEYGLPFETVLSDFKSRRRE